MPEQSRPRTIESLAEELIENIESYLTVKLDENNREEVVTLEVDLIIWGLEIGTDTANKVKAIADARLKKEYRG